MEQIEMCITSKCNLNCKHCYQHYEKNKFEIEKEEILKIIDYSIKKGIKKVVLSGGEASLHKDYYEILKYLNKKEVETVLVTNATLLDIDKLKEISPKKFKFIISIDGNEENHNKRRGEGTYNKTLNNVEKLRLLGFNVKANVTLDINNYKDIPEILDIDLFNEFSFMPVGFAGAAVENNNTSLDSEYEEVVAYIYKISNDKCLEKECKMYPKSLSLKYNGDIYPCSLARDYELLKIGNIYEDSIENILENFEKTKEFDNIKIATSKKDIILCNKCNIKDCYRGCRIRALKFFNDLNKPDPFSCKLNNKGFENISFSKIYWGEK